MDAERDYARASLHSLPGESSWLASVARLTCGLKLVVGLLAVVMMLGRDLPRLGTWVQGRDAGPRSVSVIGELPDPWRVVAKTPQKLTLKSADDVATVELTGHKSPTPVLAAMVSFDAYDRTCRPVVRDCTPKAFHDARVFGRGHDGFITFDLANRDLMKADGQRSTMVFAVTTVQHDVYALNAYVPADVAGDYLPAITTLIRDLRLLLG